MRSHKSATCHASTIDNLISEGYSFEKIEHVLRSAIRSQSEKLFSASIEKDDIRSATFNIKAFTHMQILSFGELSHEGFLNNIEAKATTAEKALKPAVIATAEIINLDECE